MFREFKQTRNLAAGADLVCRHVLLPAIGTLIGDERQRHEDDRRHQQPRPVIVASRTPEPIIVRDPDSIKLRRAADLVRQLAPRPSRAARNGYDKTALDRSLAAGSRPIL